MNLNVEVNKITSFAYKKHRICYIYLAPSFTKVTTSSASECYWSTYVIARTITIRIRSKILEFLWRPNVVANILFVCIFHPHSPPIPVLREQNLKSSSVYHSIGFCFLPLFYSVILIGDRCDG